MYDYQNVLKSRKYKTKNSKNIIKKDLSKKFDYENKKSINELSDEDDRLIYVLITLGLGNLIHIFNAKNLSFTDLLLLSKESLKDFGLEMYQRNRIYNFSTSYNRNAKTYSIKEISDFFNSNKQFLFSPSIFNKLIKVNKSHNNENDSNLDNINNIKIYENENKYLSDDENQNNRNIETNKLRNSKNYFGSRGKSYKAGKIFKKYLLIKKGVDEFLNKLNKQKEDTENMSYKYNAFIKRINLNDNYNFINNNDKSSTKKIFNSYNINDDNDDLFLNNLNDNLNIQKNENVEYNKLLEKIEKLEQMKMEKNTYEHLNQIKNYIHEKDINLNIDEILSLGNELDKMMEIINKKEKLKQNLEKYNKKIEQRKKMIDKLENENNGINFNKIDDDK